jgi:hypothetical protein
VPHLQVVSTEASVAGAAQNLSTTKSRVQNTYGSLLPDPNVAFTDFVGTFINRALDPAEVAYINNFPSSIRESIRSAVLDALTRDVPIFVQWTPNYDFRADIYEAVSQETGTSLIVNVQSPYSRVGGGATSP